MVTRLSNSMMKDGGAIADELRITGVITPSAISSQTNNYNPTDLNTSTVLRMSSTGDQNLTGIVAPALGDGVVISLLNVGSSKIILKNEHTSSTAANRFSIVTDIEVAEKQAILLRYDGTLSRWVSFSGPNGGGTATASFEFNVRNYGAKGDGVADDTTAIQAAATACTAAGGGRLYFPRGTYLIVQSILLGSNTFAYGDGKASLIKAHQTSFVGALANFNCMLFRNVNYGTNSGTSTTGVSAITDHDIHVHNMAFDYGSVTIAGGGAHHITARYAKRCHVHNCYFNNGETATGWLRCEDTLVTGCFAENVTNSGFDQWDGAKTAIVMNCTVVGKSSGCDQGIQFSGAGSWLEAGSNQILLAAFNVIKDIRNPASNTSSGLIFNAIASGSSVNYARSFGNVIENCNIGLVFSGDGGYSESIGDIFKGVDKLPIFIQREPSTDQPSGVRIINPYLVDCDHDAGNVGLISISGDAHEVTGIKVYNTSSVLYDRVVWLTSFSSNCIVGISQADTGAIGRIQNDGTNNVVVDGVANWSKGTYTPLVNFGVFNGTSGTGVTYSQNEGWWQKQGDFIFVSGVIKLTSRGSNTGNMYISLPFVASTDSGGVFFHLTANLVGISGGPLVGYIPTGYKVIGPNMQTSSATVQLTHSNVGNDGWFFFAGQYKVA